VNAAIGLLDLRLRRRPMLGYAVGLAVYAFAIVALYPSFKSDSSLDKLVQNDKTLMAAFGVNGSLTSPSGWLNANLYNNFLPLIVVILTVGYGAWSIAGQDENGTLALVASLPATRRSIVLQKAFALTVQAVPAVLLTLACVVAGRAFDLHVGTPQLWWTTVAVWLLAVDFGAAALLVGTVTGNRGVALGVASGLAAAAYLVSSLAASVRWLHPGRIVSPFYWAVGNDPLDNGVSALAFGVLAGIAVALVAATVAAIERTDLH
jgi:ABC-2 type transport system permease protein